MDQYERVLLRLVGTEDEAFSGVCYVLLPMVMRKLLEPLPATDATPGATQKKVIDILNHVLQRAKACRTIFLPFFGILDLITTEMRAERQGVPSANPTGRLLFKNLSMIFLGLAIERLEELASSSNIEAEASRLERSNSGHGFLADLIKINKLPTAAATFFKATRTARTVASELIKEFHLFPRAHQPQIFLAVLHAFACFYPTNVASLVFGLTNQAKSALLEIDVVAQHQQELTGGETVCASKPFHATCTEVESQTAGLLAFLTTAREFFLIPGNAIETKPPAIAGMSSMKCKDVSWVWKFVMLKIGCITSTWTPPFLSHKRA
ncbi:unnamed protein product [Amoebophrya sp. A120]|nr:unnamed protein product [Amoebophrya sp. A120]|eukprot:GSA120T00005980001.1